MTIPPGYFDYDDPRDYEEWCDWDDPYRSNVTDETVVSRAWLGVQSDGTLTAPELTLSEITDRSPLITPELDGKPAVPLSGSDGRIPGDFQFSYMDTPLPEDPGVGEQALLEAPGLASEFDVQLGQLLSRSGGLIPDVARFLCMKTTFPGRFRSSNPGILGYPGSSK